MNQLDLFFEAAEPWVDIVDLKTPGNAKFGQQLGRAGIPFVKNRGTISVRPEDQIRARAILDNWLEAAKFQNVTHKHPYQWG